jgi:hypothetical protein
MEAPDGLILKAMVNGITKGRGGKGSVFVFAAGNGGGQDDQCNFDGYTNSIFSITIGAIDRRGLHPYYSEMCSAMMVVAPSSGSGDHIVSSRVLNRRNMELIRSAHYRCRKERLCKYAWRYKCGRTSCCRCLCSGSSG